MNQHKVQAISVIRNTVMNEWMTFLCNFLRTERVTTGCSCPRLVDFPLLFPRSNLFSLLYPPTSPLCFTLQITYFKYCQRSKRQVWMYKTTAMCNSEQFYDYWKIPFLWVDYDFNKNGRFRNVDCVVMNEVIMFHRNKVLNWCVHFTSKHCKLELILDEDAVTD